MLTDFYEIKLNKCPLCGSENVKFYSDTCGRTMRSEIRCEDCSCNVYSNVFLYEDIDKDRLNLIELWNNRKKSSKKI